MQHKSAKVLGRMLAFATTVVCATSLSGCLSCLHPVQGPSHEARAFCRDLPAECRSNVYIFMFNGADPTCCGNLAGVRDYLNEIGFGKTYYGQLYHAEYCAKELHKVHAERPNARFVIIGFDYGADAARQLAEAAGAAQVPVDLLLYLEPRGLGGSACCPGVPIQRIVNVCADAGWFGKTAELSGAENPRICDAGKFGVPTHHVTIDLITRELTTVALSIPTYSQLDGPIVPLVDPAPSPRPITARKVSGSDEWDFLKLHKRQVVTEGENGASQRNGRSHTPLTW